MFTVNEVFAMPRFKVTEQAYGDVAEACGHLFAEAILVKIDPVRDVYAPLMFDGAFFADTANAFPLFTDQVERF